MLSLCQIVTLEGEKKIQKLEGLLRPPHPSSFFFPETRLLLTIYVDDLLLSGPTGADEKVWSALRSYPIEIEDPEPLSRFLGRHHEVQRVSENAW